MTVPGPRRSDGGEGAPGPAGRRRADRRRAALRLAAGSLGVVVLVAALAVAALGVLATGVGVAGDNVAILTPSPETVAADPGDSIEVQVALRSTGGYHDVGVQSLAFRALYHPDYLEVTDVEPASWLEQGEETTIETQAGVVHERGIAAMEQRRDPPAGGAEGNARLATLTVEVPEDAPASNATLAFHETRVLLTDRFPQPVHETNVTVTVDGGGDSHDSYDHGDLEDVDLEAQSPDEDGGDGDRSGDGTSGDGGSASADDDGSDETDSTGGSGSTDGADSTDGDGDDGLGDGADTSDDGGDDPLDGNTPLVAITALFATVAGFVALHRRSG